MRAANSRIKRAERSGVRRDVIRDVTDGETVWTCYYSDFPICRVGADGATTGWPNDPAGAGRIAVYEDRVALIGGYNGLFDRLVLCERGGSIVERPSTWQPVLPGGDVLPAGIWMAARGRYVHVLSSNTISASAAVSSLRSALDLLAHHTTGSTFGIDGGSAHCAGSSRASLTGRPE